jgi:hypothetical protein
MLTETSIQAQFLIPMAITLSFGLVAGTAGTLVLMPALLQIFEDLNISIGLMQASKNESDIVQH